MSLAGRKVLVTGADGFIGSHLAERLVSEGAQVRALVWYNSFGRAGWLDDSEIRDEVERLCADAGQAADMLGWRAEVDLERGLEATIAWIGDNLGRYHQDGYVL